MVFTQLQKDILIGLMLGDGNLEFDGYKSSRLQVKQSEPKKEYVLWLFSHFSAMVRTPPKQRLDTRQWYFGTRSTVELEHLRSIFYQNRRKIVPMHIGALFKSPITLAVWFMDDGSLDYRLKYHYSFSLSTDAFRIEEVRLLQRVLERRFGIQSSVQTPSSRGTKYVKLYIGKDGRDRFLETINPYILSCFAYKLPPYHQSDPSETDRANFILPVR